MRKRMEKKKEKEENTWRKETIGWRIFGALEEKKNRERKGGKYLERENFCLVEEKKNRLQGDGRKEHRRLNKRLKMIIIENRTWDTLTIKDGWFLQRWSIIDCSVFTFASCDWVGLWARVSSPGGRRIPLRPWINSGDGDSDGDSDGDGDGDGDANADVVADVFLNQGLS